MLYMRLCWDSEQGREITDRAQLDRMLDVLLAGPAAAGPLIAHLVGEAGALGLGLDPAGGGLLLFAPADRDRPALHSVGHAPQEGNGLVFAVGGRRYEFSARCRVPAKTVRAAAGEYLATGELPLCVTWEPEPSAQPG
jgi:hypothetical protein